GVVAVSTLEERAAEVLVASGQFTNVVAGRRPDVPALNTPDVEQEWSRRAAWVAAHFERKEAYEQRWQLAATQAETPPAAAARESAPADTAARPSVGEPVSAPQSAPASDPATQKETAAPPPAPPAPSEQRTREAPRSE